MGVIVPHVILVSPSVKPPFLFSHNVGTKGVVGAHTVEEKEEWFYKWADDYDVWNDYSYTRTNENEPGSSHTFTGNNSFLKLTKTKHNGKLKTRIISEVPTSIKSELYISEHQK